MLHQRKTPPQLHQDVVSDTEETAQEVCLECSEWLGRALLCSCQVPSSSSANSSPSQSANATAGPAAGALSEGRAKSSSGSIEQRSSSRHSSAERSDKIYGSSQAHHSHAAPDSNGNNGFTRPHQQTITAEINVAPQQRGAQSHHHHSMQHPQHHHHPQRIQRVQYQHQ